MSSLPLWQIDDGKLSYYYVAQSTEYGIYYVLQTPTPGYPEGFYAADRDFEIAGHNQQMADVESSGRAAQKARGKSVADDTALPSEKIAGGAAAADGQILSSGEQARRRRGKDDKE
ncbi:hypothetical protein BDZ45DRAFT_239695 [Acephala macrosclerotiorum]|nr:hypothetical protein BDZ45DRAFT_239695 [Acephala macrosclerotiorum]